MTAHLSGADAHFADLRGAKLAHAKLGRATLTGAKLRRADLTGADLKGAHLGGADLTNANLTGADISGETFSDHDSDAAENAGLTKGLDLSGYLADRTPQQQKHFLATEKDFLDSLSPDELATFNLTPEKLAKFRREASGG